jgi:hypothetical protein
MSKILNIGDNLEFLASGYTSQNDKSLVPAVLKIRTAKDSTQNYMEPITLPAIPLQRWTVVTIVKEGRRFDIYYGTLLVASKLCNNVPVSPFPGSSWAAGAAGWKGQIGLFNVSQKASTKRDVVADVESMVNTRGIPYYLDRMNFDFSVNMPTCMLGNCNMMPAVKPVNPFAIYASNVS